MKRFYLIAILITICGMTAMAQNNSGMAHHTPDKNRLPVVINQEFLQPFINYEGKIEVIGCVNYYYTVTITKGLSFVWSETIGKGYDNVIDFNDFEEDVTYVINVMSSQGTTIVWRLENGVFIDPYLPGRGGVTNHLFDEIPLLDY
jgi:hypothetical protein